MEALSDGDPEGVATVIRLGLSYMVMTATRLTDAMILDRLDAELDQIDEHQLQTIRDTEESERQLLEQVSNFTNLHGTAAFSERLAV